MYVRRSPAIRLLSLTILYLVGLIASFYVAYQLRWEFRMPPHQTAAFLDNMLWVLPLKLALLYAFRQFAGLLAYFSLPDLRRLVSAMLLASGVMLGYRLFSADTTIAPPKSVILADLILSLGVLTSIRLGFRMVKERFFTGIDAPARRTRRVAIIGAGDVGASLAKELLVKRKLALEPVAFFDDDKSKWRSRIHDVPVLGAPETLLNPELNLQLDEAIIAMPRASAKRIGEVVALLQRSRLKFETVPALDQLATGKVKVTQLRNVEIEDLLGRDPVQLEMENIRHILRGKIVMVTGAGGSIGSELCRQIAEFNPSRLLMVEQSEVQIFQIEQEMIERGAGAIVQPLVADILDSARMRQIFERFQPQVIFHAAAHKHVPMMESQPSEAIKNNSIGTARLAELALEHGVERFVLISTDKAINPTNVMGASKRLAEIFIQSLHSKNPSKTKFMAVRFGNVLGSSGSVVPTFKKQIAAGGPVRVTHPDVTRYFMTIPEAVALVLQSGAQGSGGEIFVLDMGKPVKIVDLARQLIELSGLRPDEDIEIEFVGLRPGEKLYEELSHKGENITPTTHPKIMRFVAEPEPFDRVCKLLEEMNQELHHSEPMQLKMMLKKAVPEYHPYVT